VHLGSACYCSSCRRLQTRFKCDCSSDVCSSDLDGSGLAKLAVFPCTDPLDFQVSPPQGSGLTGSLLSGLTITSDTPVTVTLDSRSEERRVGKERRGSRAPDQETTCTDGSGNAKA